MTELVPASEIEAKVGVPRHPLLHHGRDVSTERKLYILHSQECLASGIDLRECVYSIALDHTPLAEDWAGHQDKPVALSIEHHLLTPVRACSECGCTDDYGCEGGCWWIGPSDERAVTSDGRPRWRPVDICSSCILAGARRMGFLNDNPPECANHLERQHRDGNPPWCNACGWTHGRPAIPARQVVEPKGQR